MTAVAAVAGYVIGSVPTAAFLGRLRGVDLLAQGSGNPGTANALRTSGALLATLVLLVESGKGFAAVVFGHGIADETGAIAAGLGAVAGNVYNLWYRFGGGKGLGISLGVLGALWPTVLLPLLVVIGIGIVVTRSAGLASLMAISALIVSSFLWSSYAWPTGGVEPTTQLQVLAVGVCILISWKHWRDSPLTALARR